MNTSLSKMTLALVCCALHACGGAADPQAEVAAKPALTVEVVTARTESWPGLVAASGAIAPWQEASIGSELGGVRLEEVRVNVGDTVERGQLLARFSEDSLQADLAQLNAVVAEAEAALAKAKLDAEVANRMEAVGGLSKQEINSVRTQVLVSDARLASARAARDAQALRLRHARVLAPDHGVISSRSATVGAVAVPGTELFRLIRGSRLEWRAEVRADTLAQLRKGMTATVRLPQGGSVNGTLRQIAPTVNPETLSGIVYVDLPAGTPLAAGLFVSGQFELAARPVKVLPVSAIVYRSGAQYVMTVTAENRIKEVKVQTGVRRSDAVEIIAGLAADARVALAGGAFLNEGDLVAVAAKP